MTSEEQRTAETPSVSRTGAALSVLLQDHCNTFVEFLKSILDPVFPSSSAALAAFIGNRDKSQKASSTLDLNTLLIVALLVALLLIALHIFVEYILESLLPCYGIFSVFYWLIVLQGLQWNVRNSFALFAVAALFDVLLSLLSSRVQSTLLEFVSVYIFPVACFFVAQRFLTADNAAPKSDNDNESSLPGYCNHNNTEDTGAAVTSDHHLSSPSILLPGIIASNKTSNHLLLALLFLTRSASRKLFVAWPGFLRSVVGFLCGLLGVACASASARQRSSVSDCSKGRVTRRRSDEVLSSYNENAVNSNHTGGCSTDSQLPAQKDLQAQCNRDASVPVPVCSSSLFGQDLAPQRLRHASLFETSSADCNNLLTSPSLAMASRNRRVSLPVGQLLPNKLLLPPPQTQNNVSEARGLIADMLAWKDLPPNVFSGLKAVNSLLNPHHLNAALDVGHLMPKLVENPLTGEQFSINLRSSVNLRSSPITWSTVTSATGLPTVEPEPSKPRSSSFWKHTEGADDNDLTANRRQSGTVDKGLLTIQVTDGTLYNVAVLSKDGTLKLIKKWNFPIFSFALKSPKTMLSEVTYRAFADSDFFKVFRIPLQKFFNCFHTLEKGYRDIPYHNRLHATDVLQSTYYLTRHKVSACCPEEESAPETEKEGGSLLSVLSPLELMALYTAAAMHDYDHPGRTNAYLVAVKDPKAVLYNDRSVLENYHAASSWQILTKPENYFIEQLDSVEYKRFRYLVLELILATDLKRHFEIVADFTAKVNGDGIDWQDEADRLLVMIMVIKMSDINSPSRPKDLHQEWTNRIVEEFFQQGDDEKARGLPVSNYMDRSNPQIAKLQDSFIAHLVTPLCEAIHQAGLLPIEDDEDIPVLMFNLRENHKLWLTETEESDKKAEMQCIEEEEQEQDSSSGSA